MTQHLCTDIAIYRLNWPQGRCTEKLPFSAIFVLGHMLSSWTCCNFKYGCTRLDLAVLSLIQLQPEGGFTSQEHTNGNSIHKTAGNTIPNSAQIHCGPLQLVSLGCSLTEGLHI